MNANANEGCVGWLLEISCLMGEEIKLLIAKDDDDDDDELFLWYG